MPPGSGSEEVAWPRESLGRRSFWERAVQSACSHSEIRLSGTCMTRYVVQSAAAPRDSARGRQRHADSPDKKTTKKTFWEIDTAGFFSTAIQFTSCNVGGVFVPYTYTVHLTGRWVHPKVCFSGSIQSNGSIPSYSSFLDMVVQVFFAQCLAQVNGSAPLPPPARRPPFPPAAQKECVCLVCLTKLRSQGQSESLQTPPSFRPQKERKKEK
ncbi:hypothetical protein QBC46DRAFT_115758 [Diplogelasinospora grovesii]|uniref:Uncharacterized protein n=1 Tax=Diplogelasinospora grovesii TaxID=303347 RepID=A0AAN6S8U1_9PEZI|nr:hypothetical protein QBC46DRAFT_115758 [Diplogelasinospora grovesii]